MNVDFKISSSVRSSLKMFKDALKQFSNVFQTKIFVSFPLLTQPMLRVNYVGSTFNFSCKIP